MLQPLQLKDVSVRYASQIAELRDFLAKAGSDVGSSDSLGEVAARLQQDRAFHRDLTSHIWVVLHVCDRQIGYSDLLGILAIAAAGPDFAAVASENDAHDLLRFLMDARQSLDMTPQRNGSNWNAPPRQAPATAGRATDPVSFPPPDTREAFSSAPEPLEIRPENQSDASEFSPLQTRQDFGDGRRRRVLWGAAGVSLLTALLVILFFVKFSPDDSSLAGIWPHRRPAADISNPPATALSAATDDSISASPGRRNSPATSLRYSDPAVSADSARFHTPSLSGLSGKTQAMPSIPAVYATREVSRTASALPAEEAVLPLQRSTAFAHAPSLVPDSRSNSSQNWTARPAAPAVTAGGVPSSTLSRRLDSPSIPAYASGQQIGDSAAIPNSPRLLRRHAAAPGMSSGNDSTLIAGVQPPDTSASLGTSRAGMPNTTGRGIVRPVSLGIMAANVLYSPAPTYPAAASAANVQGEVTVQADVDRNGNVASARVISGPPLLRDAALEAVQRWRYRPYSSYGKPAPMTAMAVVDFQLP